MPAATLKYMSIKRICFQTTPELVAQQRGFWAGTPGGEGITVGPLKIVPLDRVTILDERPEPESLPAYQAAFRRGVRFPPVLVQPPRRKGGKFRVVDGKHRLSACRREKATHIPVVIEEA